MPIAWNRDFLLLSPLFEPLRPIGATLAQLNRWPKWDDMEKLRGTISPVAVSENAMPIRFVPQGPKPKDFAEKYEPRIFLKGEVQTRLKN